MNETIQLIPRHSARSGSSFNVFYSDLDLDVVISSLRNLDRLRGVLQSVRRIFPFLGEVEIYRPLERKRKVEIETDLQPLLSVLRDVRKVGWMRHAERTSETRYHRAKAHRSAKKVLARYRFRTHGAKETELLGSILTEALRKQGLMGEFDKRWQGMAVTSAYLGFQLGHRVDEGISLSIPALRGLLSILPQYESYSAELAWLVDQSMDNRTRKMRRALSEHEYLSLNAHYRSRGTLPGPMRQCTRRLRWELKQHVNLSVAPA